MAFTKISYEADFWKLIKNSNKNISLWTYSYKRYANVQVHDFILYILCMLKEIFKRKKKQKERKKKKKDFCLFNRAKLFWHVNVIIF